MFASGQIRLVLRRIDAATVGALGAAARVPMGFESTPLFDVALPPITATGRRLFDVLQDIVAADPRYEWREDDGVIVLRPRVSWEVVDPLDTPVDALKLDDIHSGDAMHVLAAMVGTTSTGSISGDTARFSIDTPAGSTFLEVLNAIVRAHGRLTWTLYYGDLPRHTGVYLGLSPGTGGGFGIPPGGYVRSIETTERFPRFNSTDPLLDRIVGPTKRGEPLAINSVHDLPAFAEAIGSPTRLELLPPKVQESFVAPEGDRRSIRSECGDVWKRRLPGLLHPVICVRPGEVRSPVGCVARAPVLGEPVFADVTDVDVLRSAPEQSPQDDSNQAD